MMSQLQNNSFLYLTYLLLEYLQKDKHIVGQQR